MIVSNLNRSKSRVFQTFAMVFSLILLPLGIAAAQDYEAVTQRLKDSVDKGEITPKQAVAMLEALKKVAVDYDAVTQRLKDSVDKGEITPKQAAAMMEALKRTAAGKTSAAKDERAAKYRKIEGQIYTAVKAGKLSKEDAEKKLHGLRAKLLDGKRSGKSGKPSKAEMGAVKKKIWGAVEAGKITKEEARKHWEAYLKSRTPSDSKSGKTDEYLKSMWKQLQAAVKAGKLTQEEADAKMAELKKRKSKRKK